MRAPARSTRHFSHAGARWLTLFLTLSLVISAFAPYLATGVAAAQPGGPLPPPLPAPQRVALVGTFQTALGCPADFDSTCPQTELHDNRDGTWSAVLPVPPGSYVFRVVANSDTERSLGQGGDPNGPDFQVTVPPDAAGVYFSYDQWTGRVDADPVPALVTLRTDMGDDLAMAPEPGGGFSVSWDALPGTYGFQIFVNDQPATQDGVSLDQPFRVYVATDPGGAVLDKRTIPSTTLEVLAVDASGQPRLDSCFALVDAQGRLLSQACDADEVPDGRTILRVLNGLPNDTFLLRETATATGEPAPDLQVPLGDGDFQVTAQSAGAAQEQGIEPGEQPATAEPVEEPATAEPAADQPQTTTSGESITLQPGDAPGRLTITSVDATGQPLPGACYAIVEFGFELCDVAGTGEVIFDAVPSAPLTLRETVPPAGFAPVADVPIQIEPTGARIAILHQPDGGNQAQQTEPNATPAEPDADIPQNVGSGQVVVTLRDRNDAPVTGSCWALSSRDGGGTIEQCDADDSDDGRIIFQNVPAGRYRLQETVTPEGFAAADTQPVQVVDGQLAEVTIAYRGGRVEPGRLVLDVSDEDGNPLPQTCFDLTGTQDILDICDGQDDGRLNIPDLPPGEYTVTQTQTASGFELAQPTNVTVLPGDTVELAITNQREGTEASQEATGDVVLTISAADGTPSQDACATLIGADGSISACDNAGDDPDPQPGRIVYRDLSAGAYTLEIAPGDGSPAPDPVSVDVVAGEAVSVNVTLAADEEPLPETGNLDIRAEDADGNSLPGACYVIEIPPGGQGFGPFCDEDGNGMVSIQGVSPGPIRVIEDTPPTSAPAANPAEQDLDIAAGDLSEIVFAHGETAPQQEAAGTLDVRVSDAAGQPASACVNLANATDAYRVCDNEQGDVEPQPGHVLIPNLPAGDYEVILSDLPDGAETPEPQRVTITGGETSEATFTLGRGIGTLVILVEDEQGELLGGSCFTLDNGTDPILEVCDQGDDGRLNIPDLPAGTYTIIQTDAASGQQRASEQRIAVVSGQTVELTVTNPAEGTPATATPDDASTPEATETPPPVTPEPGAAGETGTVELQAFDDAGNPIPGQCYVLTGAVGQFGPFCDDGEGDVSGEPGVLTITGLPTGSYEAVLQISADEADVELVQQAETRRSVTVGRGNRPTRAQFRVRAQQNRRGDLLIRVRDEDGRYLAGACFALTPNGNANPTVEVCDNDNQDQNSSNGRILLTRLRTGRYTLTQTSAPPGYQTAPNQNVRIRGGSVTEVAVTNQAVQEQSASIEVRTVDRNGNLLPGACYVLMKGNQRTEACAADTGSDGITRFPDIAPGSYVVRQTQPPSGGYALGGSTAIVVDPGEHVAVTITNDLRPGSLLIRTTNQAGEPLADACYALNRDDRTRYNVCDNDANDGNMAQGVILLSSVTAGDYVLVETQPPAGYQPAEDQAVTINGNQRTQVSVVNVPIPPAERTGDLRVFKTDLNGNLLAGACFALIDSNGRLLYPACDSDDGADDGVILLTDVAIGDYTLRETRRPSADYEIAADLAVRISENVTTDVEVENALRLGRILVRTSNPSGAPLANACFDLNEDAGGAQCTDENGETLFTGLIPGVYTLQETQAPEGYLETTALDPVTVRPGSTATVEITNQPAPPPPDSGSLQVVKFYCPTTPGNGGITFIDSSDPDGGGLARTAGCDLGDARFQLNGPTGPVDFRTGAGGRYQATLPIGDFVLTELGTGASEPFTITVNTLTTVVVINYVEPEGETPATVNVVTYTCEPGFQGRIWADFADGCQDEQNLTNSIAYRLSGPFAARRVTGDSGIGGQTEFTDLPPGDYRLRQETPTGIVATYAFCGLDPDAPNGRSVGDALALRLAAGNEVTCYWFNVPEDLAGNTGAITVYKFACPVTTPSSNFDWYNRCDPQGEGVIFDLSVQNGDTFEPVITAATDADGILRITRLAPGIYNLQEVDAVWCHAESDAVDANGHVVVEAGKRSSVWIFNCVGAKRPPNTGAGPMWSGPAPAEAMPVTEPARWWVLPGRFP